MTATRLPSTATRLPSTIEGLEAIIAILDNARDYLAQERPA